MTDQSILHATFTLERTYPVTPERVFAAWADPAAKARWFAAADTEHELDFRVGGRETVHRPGHGSEPTLWVESIYQDIVPNKRIVYTSNLSANDRLSTISLTSVQIHADGDGTKLVLTEQGAFLDGQEEPSWREKGTSTWLDKLGTELQAPISQQ
jgi:uncharacterized protein YndB with AHSA1/START domain